MKRTRSTTPAGSRKLKRRKAMTKEEAKVFTETSTAVLPRSIISRGMPRRMYTKLRYFEQISLDAPSGGVATSLFRINSGYDPAVSFGGGQPKGLDQYFALYDKAVVTSAKITVKAVTNTTTNVGIFGVSLRNDTGASLEPRNYTEDPTSVHAMYSAYEPNQEVSLTYTPKWFGDSKSDSAQEDDELHFTAGADAGKICNAHVFTAALQSTHYPASVFLQVLIEYNICFFGPNTFPLS